MKKELKMPKTKFEAIVFTAITSLDDGLCDDTLQYSTCNIIFYQLVLFLIVLKSMWIEFCDCFFKCLILFQVKLLKYFAFKVCASQ